MIHPLQYYRNFLISGYLQLLMHRTSAVWHRVGVQFLKIILVDLVLEDLVLLVCHHVIETACACLIKELITKALNQARLIEKMLLSTLIGRKLCRHTNINLHTAAWFKYQIFQVLVALQAAVWSFGDSRTQFSGGGQIPRCGRVEDGDAWLPVCHLGSLSNLLPCFLAGMQGAMHCSILLAWPTWIHQTGHVQWFSERGSRWHWSVAGNLLEVGNRWKVDHSNMSLKSTLNSQFSQLLCWRITHYSRFICRCS